eukprot:10653147-Ditylum_brightwellii.AAC.1
MASLISSAALASAAAFCASRSDLGMALRMGVSLGIDEEVVVVVERRGAALVAAARRRCGVVAARSIVD